MDKIKDVRFFESNGHWAWECSFENGDKVFRSKFNSLESAIQHFQDCLEDFNEGKDT